MISCLNKLIGVRDLAGYNQPDSGRFINDLPGITTEQLEAISDQSDQYEPRLAWLDILNRAARMFEADVKTHLKPHARNYSYKSTGITGEIDRQNQDVALGNFFNGWEFDLYGRSENIAITIETATIHIVSGVDFQIRIYDSATGELLDTIGYDISAIAKPSTNVFRIMKTYPIWLHPKLFIGYEAANISTKRVNVFRNVASVSAVQVSNSASIVSDNMSAADTGLILTYNLECSVDNYVCQRISLLTDPFLHKLGIEFCNERLYSDRINRWTTLDRQTATELRDTVFMPEYKQQMEAIFSDIRFEHSDECFECARPIKHVDYLP